MAGRRFESVHCRADTRHLEHPGSRDHDPHDTRARDSLHVLPHRRRHGAGDVLMQARTAYPMTVQTNDQAADRLKINVRDAWELRWWCRQFGCTEVQLKQAIEAMGAIAGNVRKYLARDQARQ
jgi:GNAT superfamily N-acetyltransferase